MASSMLQFNYSLVDNIIAGRYVSDAALDAVGCVGPAAWLLADIPLIVIYLVKQHRFGKAKHS